MKLLDKIQNNQNNAPAPGFQRALVVNKEKFRKDPQAEGFQQLKLAVHNRLFESLDVSRLESLEANLASQKVTGAITEILNEEGRLLTDTDRTRLIEEIKNELLGPGAAGAASMGRLHHRYPGQRRASGLRRTARQAQSDRGEVPGRSASDVDHRSHRVAGRPPRR